MLPVLSFPFQNAIDKGLVSCRKHPTDDLWILNYTPECQFSKAWDDVTMQCRGLIVDAQGHVVARPFRKFFNLSEHDNPDFQRVPYGSPFKAYEKADGSLGVSYWGSGGWEIATRGSFESDQAHEATAMLAHVYHDAMQKMSKDLTFLFEVIYPENRICVDYGKERKLVLLGVIRTSDGVEFPLEDFADLGFPLPQRFDVKDLETLPRDIPNFEGYVVRFDNGLRVKVKLDEYVRLHKLMTGITANRVWEMLAAGQDIHAAIAELPDEMYDEVTQVAEDIQADHASLINLHAIALQQLQLGDLTRKEQAAKILDLCRRSQTEPVVGEYIIPLNSSILFMMLDGQVDWAKEKSWNLVKPKDGNKLICKVNSEE